MVFFVLSLDNIIILATSFKRFLFLHLSRKSLTKHSPFSTSDKSVCELERASNGKNHSVGVWVRGGSGGGGGEGERS